MVAMADRRGGGLWRAARLAAALLCLVVLRRRLAGLRIDPRCPATPRCATGWNPPWSPPAWTVLSTRCTSRACPRRRLPGWTAVRCCWRWNCPPTCPGRRPQPRRHPDRRPARHARGTPPHPRRAGRRRRLAPPDRLRRPPDAGPGTLTLIAELAAHAQQTRVWLLLPAHEDGPARAAGRAQLAALGLPAQAVLAASANALDWLETGHG